MKIQLKSEFSISNQGGFSNDDDLMVQETSTKIIVDITDRFIENFTEEECEEYFDTDPEDIMVEVGKIICSRVDLRYGEDYLFSYVDEGSLDVKPVLSYFFYDEGKKYIELFCPNFIYYIDLVFIKPEHRGYNYGLYGLALLLEAIAKDEMVVCCPCPTDENGVPVNRKDYEDFTKEELNFLCPPIPDFFDENKEEQKVISYPFSGDELKEMMIKTKEEEQKLRKLQFNEKEPKARKLLARYWSKLGLDYYDQEENLLWTMEWTMPEWIRQKLLYDYYY